MYRDLSAFFLLARIGRAVSAPVKPDVWADDPDRTTRREAY